MKRKISMARFIISNRSDLVSSIKACCGNVGRLTNSDIEEWILNDEGLYNWARSSGVDI